MPRTKNHHEKHGASKVEETHSTVAEVANAEPATKV